MNLEHTNPGIDPDSLMSSTIVTHTNGDFIYNLLTVCTNYIKTLKTAVFKKKKKIYSQLKHNMWISYGSAFYYPQRRETV